MGQTNLPPALDLGRALNEAMDVYRRNFLTFLLAGILFDLLSLCSLFVLAGPLAGGMVLMCLNALRDPEHDARFGDLFGTFNRFGAFVGFFFLTVIPILLGYALLIVPGILLTAVWLFPVHLMVDRHMGVMDALRTSWRIVVARGFWINAAVAFLITVMFLGPMLIPYVGPIICWLLSPLAWLINTSAYLQEVPETDLSEFAARGFAVVPMAQMATPEGKPG